MAASFLSKVIDFKPFEGWTPQSDEERSLELHMEQLLMNLRIAAENLDLTIHRRKTGQ